jgi:protein-L-isoaspartate O-methyltransferase
MDSENHGVRTELGRSLLKSGALSADWLPSFALVRRSAFLPDLIWPYDMATARTVAVDRTQDPELWHRYAEDNVPIVTQWDDGRHHGPEPGDIPTSSISMPSVVFSMLRDLEVRLGERVLEIGTGTGYNAALLGARLGLSQVVSVEVDPAVAATARAALERARLPVTVITGDGFEGYERGAPYDRVIATVGLREVPFAWVEQTSPGGVIVAPWGTHFSNQDAVARLVVSDDGTSASGLFTGPVEFMKLRSQRLPFAGHHAYAPSGVRGAETSSTTLTERVFTGGAFDTAVFAIGLRVPRCTHSVASKREGARPVWFYGLDDTSWACAFFREGLPEATVYQSGPRRLWDEVEAAYGWWEGVGRPGHERFGLTVDAEGQTAWLDEPGESAAVG